MQQKGESGNIIIIIIIFPLLKNESLVFTFRDLRVYYNYQWIKNNKRKTKMVLNIYYFKKQEQKAKSQVLG